MSKIKVLLAEDEANLGIIIKESLKLEILLFFMQEMVKKLLKFIIQKN